MSALRGFPEGPGSQVRAALFGANLGPVAHISLILGYVGLLTFTDNSESTTEH